MIYLVNLYIHGKETLTEADVWRNIVNDMPKESDTNASKRLNEYFNGK